MKKRLLHILNWDKYQARSDKDLPWCKLWGTLFYKPWFQKMPDSGKFFTVVLLDLARKTGNNIGEEYVFIEYLRGNYGILSTQNEVFMFCKCLSSNDFLSDNTDDLQDKIRQDKSAWDNKQEKQRTKEPILIGDFELFWSSYPKRVSKSSAQKSWQKLSPSVELTQQIVSAVNDRKKTKDWLKDGGQYIPLPATFLNNRRWEDEVVGKNVEDEWKS